MSDVKPVSPTDVRSTRKIHPDIIQIVNELLQSNFDGAKAKILQNEVVAKFMARNPDFERQLLFQEGQLDFEPIYREQNWKVEYNKPRYFESHFEAYYLFTALESVVENRT